MKKIQIKFWNPQAELNPRPSSILQPKRARPLLRTSVKLPSNSKCSECSLFIEMMNMFSTATNTGENDSFS